MAAACVLCLTLVEYLMTTVILMQNCRLFGMIRYLVHATLLYYITVQYWSKKVLVS